MKILNNKANKTKKWVCIVSFCGTIWTVKDGKDIKKALKSHKLQGFFNIINTWTKDYMN